MLHFRLFDQRTKRKEQQSALEQIESALDSMNTKIEKDGAELQRLARDTRDPNLDHLMKLVNNVMETYD